MFTDVPQGMRISVDRLGNVKGKNKNNNEHTTIAKEKIYSGSVIGHTFKLKVFFPDTLQENTYEGAIAPDGIWKGTFTLIKSCGHRSVGSGGEMEGKVKEC